MENLVVYLNQEPVGGLSKTDRGFSFQYFPNYINTQSSLPLSRHLPLQEQAFDTTSSRAFFENLLPEGSIRKQIARSLGISPENIFALLTEIGGDCAGAVSLFPGGSLPQSAGNHRLISEESLAAELNNLPSHPFLADEDGVRLSLAGAQNKLPIFFDGAQFYVPEGNAPSSHIIKTPIPYLENTVLNEAYFMNLASSIGLKVPIAAAVKLGSTQVYLVKRYDRQQIGGVTSRLHQEDFCQALGVESVFKYEKEGGPGFSDCFNLLRDWSDEPLTDVRELLRWALFNFLIGNADAHAKNISFLYADGTIRLAPFYDLLSTAVYEKQVNNKFAMRMGGQKDPRYLSQKNLETFSVEIGIGIRVVNHELRSLSDKIENAAIDLSDQFRQQYSNAVIIDRIEQVLKQRITKAKFLAATK